MIFILKFSVSTEKPALDVAPWEKPDNILGEVITSPDKPVRPPEKPEKPERPLEKPARPSEKPERPPEKPEIPSDFRPEKPFPCKGKDGNKIIIF